MEHASSDFFSSEYIFGIGLIEEEGHAKLYQETGG